MSAIRRGKAVFANKLAGIMRRAGKVRGWFPQAEEKQGCKGYKVFRVQRESCTTWDSSQMLLYKCRYPWGQNGGISSGCRATKLCVQSDYSDMRL